MTLEVIGAGFGRTGTMSLKVALERLGSGLCYHMTEVFSNPDHIEVWEAAVRGSPWTGNVSSSTVHSANVLKIRFSATLGEEPEVEVALV